MNGIFKIFGTLTIAVLMFSCSNETQTEDKSADTMVPLVTDVLSAAERNDMTPEDVLQSLKDGNQRFMNNDLTARDHMAQVRNSASGQSPKAVILSCLDSRIPVETVFDCGIGDIFVGRVAGNFVNVDLLGSMEFGCLVAGAKLILVLGHDKCGAVEHAIRETPIDNNIPAMLSNIRPAIDILPEFEGDEPWSNAAFVRDVTESNVKNTIDSIRINSPQLKAYEDGDSIMIIGAVYNMVSGEVEFLNE